MTTKLTAKNFRDPLLVALGTLSNFEAETPVPSRSTYSPICKTLGITFDQFGEDDRGKNWVSNWTLGAFKYLKKVGLAAQAGYGKWALTEDGVQVAKELASVLKEAQNTETVEPDKADDNTPKEKPVSTIGVSVPVGPGNDEAEYHPDPYIRTLAAERTPCFGEYTVKSTVCQACPLSGACKNLVAAELSALASRFEAEDKAKEETAKKTKTKPQPQTQTQEVPDVPDGGWDNTGAMNIISYMDSTCYRCGKPIPKGEKCFWLKDAGSNQNGLFHPECK